MCRDVLLAFSGGIDSCAAVELLREDGYCVHVMMIDMMGDEAMLSQARGSAERLGLPLHVVDGREIFERDVVCDFVQEYLAGRTPAPCTRCNPLVKWRLLASEADRLGIHHIATGHYFQISEVDGLFYVTRAADPKKDQSYYLWGVGQDILSRAVTPMGWQIKEEVKRRSEQKRESMGVCFLQGRPYGEFLASRCGDAACGVVVDRCGEQLGEHNGLFRYTIGQRRGEGIPEGLRVIALDAELNRVVVGENELLYQRQLVVDDCHFVNVDEVASSLEVRVMVRGIGLNPEGFATVTPIYNSDVTSGLAVRVDLAEPAWAAAPGQPVVFYIGDRVVGGGILRSAT